MNRMVKQFELQFELLKKNYPHKWPAPYIFVGVDMHQTVVKPTWSNDASEEFYSKALQTMQMMSEDPEVTLILWTSSVPEQAQAYLENMKDLGVEFKYFNENPEAANTPYGDYTRKLYFNVGLDDKFGFMPDEDWPALWDLFRDRQVARLKKAS
jgi:hypothetical protein